MRSRLLAAVIIIVGMAAWFGSPSANGGSALSPSRFYGSFPTAQPKVVFIDGHIQPRDYELFVEVVDSAKPDVIVLGSPGGRIDVALQIAVEIDGCRLNTFISANCY